MKRLALLAAAIVLLAGPADAETKTLFQDFGRNSNEPIQVEADTLEVTEAGEERVSLFTGNVTVTRGGLTMKATKLTLYSDVATPTEAKDAFNRIEASGKVYISQADQIATGDAATFNVKTQIATISGNVMLSQGKNVLSGDRVVIDLASGKARVEQTSGGRIRGVFTPSAAKAPAPGQ